MKQQTDTRTKLLTKSPWPLMIELSVPAVLGMVVVGLYNMMDSIFVGQMVGDVQMGAISVSYPFTLINAGSAAMLGVGSASVLSRAIGQKDEEVIKRIMGNLIAVVILLSALYTAIGMIFTKQLLSLAGASGSLLGYAEKYLRIVFAGSLFVNFFQSANMVIRGEGQLKKAMLIIGSGAILNMLLDPIFIATLRPRGMGIEAAACATVFSQFVQAAVTLWYFRRKSPPCEDRAHLAGQAAAAAGAFRRSIRAADADSDPGAADGHLPRCRFIRRRDLADSAGRGAPLLELCLCASMGDQSGLPAGGRHQLRRRGL